VNETKSALINPLFCPKIHLQSKNDCLQSHSVHWVNRILRTLTNGYIRPSFQLTELQKIFFTTTTTIQKMKINGFKATYIVATLLQKTRTFLSFLYLFFLATTVSAQFLEIHQVNIGTGDATIIVVRDTGQLRKNVDEKKVREETGDEKKVREETGEEKKVINLDNVKSYKWLNIAIDNNIDLNGTVRKAILIDAGENSKAAIAIRKRMSKLGIKKFDYVIISHMDKDHYGGLNDLLNKYDIAVDSLILRTGLTSYITALGITASNDKIRPKVKFVDDTTAPINLGQDIRLTCLGAGMKLARQKQITPAISNPASKKEKNNQSLVWVLQLGAFRYYTGGDLNGHTDNGYNPRKIDLETPLMDSLLTRDTAKLQDISSDTALNRGHFCSLKLNHHGSEHSTNKYFLAVMKPKTAFISSGSKFGHPRSVIIKALDIGLDSSDWDITPKLLHGKSLIPKTIVNYFMTNLSLYHRGKEKSFFMKIGTSQKSTGIIGGDIITVVDSEDLSKSAYYVFWDGITGSHVLSSTDLQVPNNKGELYFECHRSLNGFPEPYLTNR
jgi:competence protein ComEC